MMAATHMRLLGTGNVTEELNYNFYLIFINSNLNDMATFSNVPSSYSL